MRELYYGVDDGDGKVPGTILDGRELISTVLIPVENLDNIEKPGKISLEEEEPEVLEDMEEIDPSDYVVMEWKNGKAKRIYSGMMGKLNTDWKDIEKLEVYGDGSLYANEEKVKGQFTITQGSNVLVKDVQEVCLQTDEQMEKEYYHCLKCDKEVKSFKAIEDMSPGHWDLDPDSDAVDGEIKTLEKRKDGSSVLHGICPECSEKD